MTEQGCGIGFSREGRAVLAVDAQGVSITPLRDGADTLRIAAEGVRGVAGFADQIWIVDGTVPRLRRFDEQGRPIGAPRALPDEPGARLAPILLGPPAATWGALALYDDLGTLRDQPAPAGDLAIPLTARRWLVARGNKLELGNGVTATLPLRITSGEILCDGSLVAVASDRELFVLTRSSGTIQRKLHLTSQPVYAARRGLAIISLDASHHEVIDLRSGRSLGAIRQSVSELAIDPDGRTLALRLDTVVELMPLDEAFRASTPLAALATLSVSGEEGANTGGDTPDPTTDPAAADGPSIAETSADTAAAAVPAAAAVAAAAAAAAAVSPTPILHALCPRPSLSPFVSASARRAVDAELQTVGLRALLAIATAWDTRRLGYADESANPFEHEVAALLGLNGGFATEHVVTARARLAEHELTQQIDVHHRAPTTPIGALRDELGLSELALDLLFVIAAPALWGETARLYGILTNDPGRALVDELLACTLLSSRAPRHEIQRELDPRSPLVRTGAVRIAFGRGRPFAALSVDPVVLARLAGETPDLGEAITVRSIAPALDELALPRRVITTAIAALSRPSAAPARLAIRGRHGAGLRTLCASLAGEANRELAVIDAGRLPPGLDAFRAAMATALRQANLAGHLPCVIHLDRVAFEDGRGRDAVGDVLRAHPGPLAVILPPDAPAPFDPGHCVLDVPVTTEIERHATWSAALAEHWLAVHDVAGLAARYRIGVAAIRRAVATVAEARATSVTPATGDATAELETFLRQDREMRIGEHARRVERLATWSQLVLPPDVLDSLRELIGRVRHRRQVFDGWGMGRTMSTSRGLTALFAGQPGTGKTLVAGVVARELGLDLYQVDLSKVVSRWLGETERNLGAIFDAAEEGQCVLLFDEADSLFAKRTEVKSSNDRYANLEVNYLLQRLDSFEGIAILTTNFGGSIDPAFKRRMSFKLSFPFPDEDTREALWRVHLPDELPVHGALDLAALSRRFQLSGGYIRNACLRAAFLAAQEETPVTHSHLERAVTLEFAELGKLSSSGALD
jgi:hypothetical protein